MTTTLYRPVNKKELDLIKDSDWKRFPPRLPEQPIFYPVMNLEYARQITVDWNVPAYGNGYITKFEVKSEYLKKFEIQNVGGEIHNELWIPVEEASSPDALRFFGYVIRTVRNLPYGLVYQLFKEQTFM